ncbi:MAG: glutathione S-transferase N-terminal domain-containing protein [Sedimenticola sp.]
MAVVANKRSVMTLYSDARSPYSHRVRLVLAEKSITVEIMDTDPVDISEDIMDLNPYGTLPTLVDRDLTLYESRIIMEYLDERFPHPPLLPVDPVARASSRLFMHRVDHDWYTLMDEILAGGKGATKARKELRESLTVSAPIFAAKPFFMSDDFTLVDCSIAPILWRLPMMGVELPAAAKAVDEYAQRMFERESFKECLTEAELEMRE